MTVIVGGTFFKAKPVVPKRALGTARLTPIEREIASTFTTAVTDLAATIDTTLLARALSSGSVSNAVQAFDWGQFGDRLSTTRLSMMSQITQTGNAEARQIGDVIGAYAFDVTDPRATAWAAARSGELVVQVSDDIRSQIRERITSSFVNQIDPREIARELRQVVGLHDRWAQAVVNQYDRNFADFLRQGYSASDAADRARALADQYRERLIATRASTIARTEVMTAANQGRFIAWQQAGDAGLIDLSTAYKEWIAEGDACPDCAAVDGWFVPVDDVFDFVGEEMPPAHPNCRCTAVLVPAEDVDPDKLAEQQAIRDELAGESTLEDITPEPESESVETEPEIAPEIEAIRDAIDAVPDWTAPDEDGGDRMMSFETPGGEPSEFMVGVGEQVREVGAMIDDEIERRLIDAGFGGGPSLDEVNAARDEQRDLRAQSGDALYDAMVAKAESLGMTRETWLESLNYDLTTAKEILYADNPELRVLNNVARESEARWETLQRAYDEAQRERATMYPSAMQSVLADIRDMGVDPRDPVRYGYSDRMTDTNQRESARALAYYPTDWISRSNALGPMEVADIKPDDLRGFYGEKRDGSGAVIHIPASRETDSNLYVHEWAHRMENANERIRNLEWEFLNHRAGDEQPRPMSELTGWDGYRTDEKGIGDDFGSPYSGKIYNNAPDAPYEVLSMGMEGIVANSYGLLARDVEYRHFVLGTLAVA